MGKRRYISISDDSDDDNDGINDDEDSDDDGDGIPDSEDDDHPDHVTTLKNLTSASTTLQRNKLECL